MKYYTGVLFGGIELEDLDKILKLSVQSIAKVSAF